MTDTPLYAALVAQHGDPRAEHVAGELPADDPVNPVHDGTIGYVESKADDDLGDDDEADDDDPPERFWPGLDLGDDDGTHDESNYLGSW